MLHTTVTFWAHVFLYHFALIRSEGALRDVRGWWRLFRFLWIKPGGMWRMWRVWLREFPPPVFPRAGDNPHTFGPLKGASAGERRGAAPKGPPGRTEFSGSSF